MPTDSILKTKFTGNISAMSDEVGLLTASYSHVLLLINNSIVKTDVYLNCSERNQTTICLSLEFFLRLRIPGISIRWNCFETILINITHEGVALNNVFCLFSFVTFLLFCFCLFYLLHPFGKVKPTVQMNYKTGRDN